MAIKVFEKYFDEVYQETLRKRYSGDSRLSDEQLRSVINQIIKLNPKPAGSVGSTNKAKGYGGARFIYNNNGKPELTLNSRTHPTFGSAKDTGYA